MAICSRMPSGCASPNALWHNHKPHNTQSKQSCLWSMCKREGGNLIEMRKLRLEWGFGLGTWKGAGALRDWVLLCEEEKRVWN
jgi:hypothetical protein